MTLGARSNPRPLSLWRPFLPGAMVPTRNHPPRVRESPNDHPFGVSGRPGRPPIQPRRFYPPSKEYSHVFVHRQAADAAAKEESGFTLIELLIVLVIIGILLAIAVPSYLGFKDRARSRPRRPTSAPPFPSVEAYYADTALHQHGPPRPASRLTRPGSRASMPASRSRSSVPRRQRATASATRRAASPTTSTAPQATSRPRPARAADPPRHSSDPRGAEQSAPPRSS